MAGRAVEVRRLTRVGERLPGQEEAEDGGGLEHPVPLDSERGLPLLRATAASGPT